VFLERAKPKNTLCLCQKLPLVCQFFIRVLELELLKFPVLELNRELYGQVGAVYVGIGTKPINLNLNRVYAIRVTGKILLVIIHNSLPEKHTVGEGFVWAYILHAVGVTF
jgi:hypothetical protein